MRGISPFFARSREPQCTRATYDRNGNTRTGQNVHLKHGWSSGRYLRGHLAANLVVIWTLAEPMPDLGRAVGLVGQDGLRAGS
jgi:hypothetical protein